MLHFPFPSPAQKHLRHTRFLKHLHTNPPSSASSCQAIPINSQLKRPFLSSFSSPQPQVILFSCPMPYLWKAAHPSGCLSLSPRPSKMSLSRCSWKTSTQTANGSINYCQVLQWSQAQTAIKRLVTGVPALAAKRGRFGRGSTRARGDRGTTTPTTLPTGRGRAPRTAPRPRRPGARPHPGNRRRCRRRRWSVVGRRGRTRCRPAAGTRGQAPPPSGPAGGQGPAGLQPGAGRGGRSRAGAGRSHLPDGGHVQQLPEDVDARGLQHLVDEAGEGGSAGRLGQQQELLLALPRHLPLGRHGAGAAAAAAAPPARGSGPAAARPRAGPGSGPAAGRHPRPATTPLWHRRPRAAASG